MQGDIVKFFCVGDSVAFELLFHLSRIVRFVYVIFSTASGVSFLQVIGTGSALDFGFFFRFWNICI